MGGPAAGETVARIVEAAGGAVVGRAVPMEASIPTMGVVAGVAEAGMAFGEAVEVRRTVVEVAG